MKRIVQQIATWASTPSRTVECTTLLMELADIGNRCAGDLRNTHGTDLGKIIAHEHAGDDIEKRVREILLNTTFMRFKRNDIKDLAMRLDDCIDRMRKVAEHVHVYKMCFQSVRAEAIALFDLVVLMSVAVKELVSALQHKPLDGIAIGKLVERLDKYETRADEIRREQKQLLVTQEFAAKISSIEFRAWAELYDNLERATDSMNHVGAAIHSLALWEA
jgi:predicted phosphate transport protein (TIGR00153 family)